MGKRTVIIVSFLTATVVFFVALDLLINTERYRILEVQESLGNRNSGPQMPDNTNGSAPQDNQNIALEDGNGNSNTTVRSYILTTDLLETAGFLDTKIEDVKTGVDLFGVRLDTLSGEIMKRYMYQGDFPIGMVYEVDPMLTYTEVRDLLATRMETSPVLSLNENGTYGKQSLYLNNANRSTTTFILIEFNTVILGFEYPKDKHSLFEKLFENLQLTY